MAWERGAARAFPGELSRKPADGHQNNQDTADWNGRHRRHHSRGTCEPSSLRHPFTFLESERTTLALIVLSVLGRAAFRIPLVQPPAAHVGKVHVPRVAVRTAMHVSNPTFLMKIAKPGAQVSGMLREELAIEHVVVGELAAGGLAPHPLRQIVNQKQHFVVPHEPNLHHSEQV